MLIAVMAALACLGGSGCSNSSPDASPARPAGPPQLADSLGAPADLPSRGTSAADLTKSGDEYETGLPNNLVFPIPGRASYQPSGPAGGPLDSVAYAVYSFDVAAYSGPGELHLGWELAPIDGHAWLGLANYVSNCWEFFSLPADGVLSFDLAGGNYTRPDGFLYAAVILVGLDGAALRTIGLSDNTPPIAKFNAAGELLVNFNDVLTLEATPSFDPDGSIVKYEFDLEDDGTYFDKGSTPSISHKYSKSGHQLAHLRVTDNDGASAETTVDVVVSWLHTISDGIFDSACNLIIDPNDGNLIYVGAMQNVGQGGFEGFVGKYDFSLGEPIWEKSYGEAGNDFFYGLAQDQSSHYYVAGASNDASASCDGVLLKVDADGSLLWDKVWDFAFTESQFCAVDSQERLYFLAQVDGGPGMPNNIFIAQLDLDGVITWQKEYALDDDLYPYGLCFDDADNVYICAGVYVISNSNRDALLISLEPDGQMRFARRMDCGVDEDFTTTSFDGTTVFLGGVLDLGSSDYDSLLAGVGVDGSLKWVESYVTGPGDEGILGNSVPIAGGGCMFSGTAMDPDNYYDALLLLLNEEGDVFSVTALGERHVTDQALCIAGDPYQGVYFGGQLGSIVDSTYTYNPGSLTVLSHTLVDEGDGSWSSPSHSLSAGSGAYADLTGLTRDEGGALIGQFFPQGI
jgi:hypothetical protein